MKINVLIENTTKSKKLKKQYGLSIYIETKGKKILHDLGGDKLFIKNADELGIDINAVDLAVISHGHFDHGGGLKPFIKANNHAKIYIHKNAFIPHYTKLPLNLKYNVGIDKSIKDNKNVVLTDGQYAVTDDIILFSDIELKYDIPSMNKALLSKVNNEYIDDTFNHEQYMLINENNKYYLFVGCAHRGVLNIVEQAEKLCGQQIDYVIGGFHLYNPASGKSEPDEYILSIADYMKNKKTTLLTGHCTGEYAFNLLKQHLGNKIEHIYTGYSLEV